MKLYVKLQTPIIELPVEAKDASGAYAKIIVGFKRYTKSEVLDKMKELETTQADIQEASFDFNAYEAKVLQELKQDILYLKDVSIDIFNDDGTFNFTLEIKDTRTPPPSSFWGDEKECLSVLVDQFLNSTPWRDSFIEVRQQAWINKYQDDKVKN